jgi:hypothetical protein
MTNARVYEPPGTKDVHSVRIMDPELFQYPYIMRWNRVKWNSARRKPQGCGSTCFECAFGIVTTPGPSAVRSTEAAAGKKIFPERDMQQHHSPMKCFTRFSISTESCRYRTSDTVRSTRGPRNQPHMGAGFRHGREFWESPMTTGG